MFLDIETTEHEARKRDVSVQCSESIVRSNP